MQNGFIKDYNANQQDKFSKLNFNQAKFIDGKILLNIFKRDFCLAFDA
jgi:hypothetical protein